MGEFNKAAEISRANLEPMTNIDSIENACFLAQLGIIISRKGDRNTALSYLEKALKIFEKRLPLNDPTIVMVETSIGDVYRLLGDYPTALLHSKKGLEMSENVLQPDDPSLVALHWYTNRWDSIQQHRHT